jgi:hypothetical protein
MSICLSIEHSIHDQSSSHGWGIRYHEISPIIFYHTILFIYLFIIYRISLIQGSSETISSMTS